MKSSLSQNIISRMFLLVLFLIVLSSLSSSSSPSSSCVNAQSSTTTNVVTTISPTTTTVAATSTTSAVAATATTSLPPTTTSASGGTPVLTVGDPSVVDLIFSFFAEDSDSINSYAVTIAQNLGVPTRRIDFYNVQPGDTTDPLDRTPSNTPFGSNTMARVTVQPPFFTETLKEASKSVRDRLVARVKAGNVALTGIFIIDAYPIDSKVIFSYSVRTVFDLMYMFVIGTMGIAYLGFISFVIYKIVQAHRYAKIEKLNRQKEKEERKTKKDAMRRAGLKMDADFDDDDDDNEQIDASKFDEFAGDGDDDDGGDYVRDEDGLAIRSLAADVAHMLEANDNGGEGGGGRGGGGVRFSEGSRRPAVGKDNSNLLKELNRLALPPPSSNNKSNKKAFGDEEDDL